MVLNNESFLMYVRNMYYENCKERSIYGEEPYASADVYFQKNKDYLKEEYKLQKK